MKPKANNLPAMLEARHDFMAAERQAKMERAEVERAIIRHVMSEPSIAQDVLKVNWSKLQEFINAGYQG